LEVQRSKQSWPSAPQDGWQAPPEQVSVGPQGWPQVPQLASLVASDAQVPSQMARPGAHEVEQAPLTQTCPVEQAWLQAPQLVTLELVSTQPRPHSVRPAGHVSEVH
jgi:hypothetical protein